MPVDEKTARDTERARSRTKTGVFVPHDVRVEEWRRKGYSRRGAERKADFQSSTAGQALGLGGTMENPYGGFDSQNQKGGSLLADPIPDTSQIAPTVPLQLAPAIAREAAKRLWHSDRPLLNVARTGVGLFNKLYSDPNQPKLPPPTGAAPNSGAKMNSLADPEPTDPGNRRSKLDPRRLPDLNF